MATLNEAVPSVVVLDLHLPNVPGDEILDKIKSDHKFDKTLVIVTTADHLMANSLQGQADFVMIKPVGYNLLRDLGKRLILN